MNFCSVMRTSCEFTICSFFVFDHLSNATKNTLLTLDKWYYIFIEGRETNL